jgi:hypothetical protein
MGHFRDNFIFRSCIAGSILEQFIKVNHYYEDMLVDSIKVLEDKYILKKRKEIFYNYILIDANAMFKLLENMSNDQTATIDNLVLFKYIIIYVGKGCRLRKTDWVNEGWQTS